MPDARIISQLQVPDFQPGGRVAIRTQITYVIGITPPRTISLPIVDPTTDQIADAIRRDQAGPGPTPGPLIPL
jgi:hypothetical protein